MSHPTKTQSLLDFPTLEESKLISPLVKKMSRESWRNPTKTKIRKSKGLTSGVLVIVAAICVQRYARGYLVRKKLISRKASSRAAGVAKRAAVHSSSVVSNTRLDILTTRSILEASRIASCASTHAAQQALLARSCRDDVMKRRDQDQAALLSAVAAFAASVAARYANTICLEVSSEILKLKKVQEQENNVKQKKKKRGKTRKKKGKKKKNPEETLGVKQFDDTKSLPFLSTSVQYWSPIQKVSTQNGIPDSMIVRAQVHNIKEGDDVSSRRSLSPPRRMKIECDEISQRILTPVVMHGRVSKVSTKREAPKPTENFEKIQKHLSNQSELSLTRGEETKRLTLDTHKVDVATPLTPSSSSLCADINLEDGQQISVPQEEIVVKEGVVSLPTKEEEDVVISSVTPQESLRHSRNLRNNRKRSDHSSAENSCACACVVM